MMSIPEGPPQHPAHPDAFRVAAQETRAQSIDERLKPLFNKHFDRYKYEKPQQLQLLRDELLGTAVAMGLGNEKDLEKIRFAATLAEVIHRPQKRKHTGDPYVVHTYRSALLAMELADAMEVPVTTELIVGALLHDAVEDHSHYVTKAFLREKFAEFDHNGKYGQRIANDSYALSRKENGVTMPDKKYLARIRDAYDRETLRRRYIIKTADRIDNLLDPPISPDNTKAGTHIRDKRRGIIDKTEHDIWTLLYVQPQELPEIPTEFLRMALLTAVELSEASLVEENFNSDEWESYLEEAA